MRGDDFSNLKLFLRFLLPRMNKGVINFEYGFGDMVLRKPITSAVCHFDMVRNKYGGRKRLRIARIFQPVI